MLMMGHNVFSQILTPLKLLFLIENYYEVGMKYFSDGWDNINWTFIFWNSCDLKWPPLGDIYVSIGVQCDSIKKVIWVNFIVI